MATEDWPSPAAYQYAATMEPASLAWEFLPLSFVYVVVTDTRSAYRAPDAVPNELRIVAKVTYTWRP